MLTMKHGLLWIAVIVAGCGTSRTEREPRDSSAPELEEHLTDQKAELESAIAQELAQLEREFGALRSDADVADEDFTAELLHIDQLIEELGAHVEQAHIQSLDDLESLRGDTRRRLDDIRQAYSALEQRVEEAYSERPKRPLNDGRPREGV